MKTACENNKNIQEGQDKTQKTGEMTVSVKWS
jgi:hypothetical protein